MYDVHVVEAGPAGSFAAYTAAVQGKKVLLSEEHPQVGSPVACSGLVSKSGLEEMSDLVNYRKITINSLHGAIIYSGRERFAVKAAEGDKAYLFDRRAFDLLACESAVSEGAKLALSDHVDSASVAAPCVIGADGPNSAMALGFGFPKIRNFIITMQADFEMPVEDARMISAYI
ncbi:MAG TPA: NAD(P)/FAD-dependent oxidoreductase, partial [Candidatus Micrarchaeota archaeon]|nr:NAD(P)/FAD-dependent oxidoreductase [Candidatus Micrarchaeota archaeon]